MKEEYLLTIGCKGYVSKPDPTNLDDNFLVAGSQNMVINDQERVETRAGYELFGVADTTTNPPKSEFSWKDSSGSETLLREANGVLQWYSSVSSAFETLLTGLSTTKPIRFAPAWNPTELIDILLFVNNSSTLYEWSGGNGTYVSSTSTTIVISQTISSQRFLTTGTRLIRVKDSGGTWREFTVTSQTGSTFTVTEDPTAYIFTVGAIVIQSVRTNASTPVAGFTNDVIEVFQNQLFVGSNTSQRLYVSKNTSYTDFTFSTPRVAGEGALITLDCNVIGLKTPGTKETDNENKIVVFGSRNRGYKVTFEISPGSTADREVPRVKPLPLAEGQGAKSHELIEKVGQTIVWLSNDNELLDLASIENNDSIKNVSISDPISPDFLAATFTNGVIKFWRNSIFITAPSDGKVFIFNVAKRFWQPPQILGVRLMSVYSNLLYGHSNVVTESYKLFTGVNDNANPISFKAHWAYRNGGKRFSLKNFSRFFTELYLAANTKVTVSLLFEWLGSKQIQSYELNGADTAFTLIPSVDASLGVNSLGTNPLGGVTSATTDLPKYRRFKPIVAKDHFEYQVRFESEVDDAAFQILASGANIKWSDNEPTAIIK